jgi:Cu+-exporting ATPase
MIQPPIFGRSLYVSMGCSASELLMFRCFVWAIILMFVFRHCPEKIMAAVESLGPQVKVVQAVTTFTNRALELTYQPSPPSFTIREIISAIASSKSPPFQVSIYHPPSLEDHARTMQAMEFSALLRRLILAVIIVIPTFVIAVIFMSLVKNGNATKAFLMRPMWAGNASRSQWALLFLATPVQFYSANIFHWRSIKEIRVLWRKGNTTPVYKRFIRFGSMNLLVRPF